MIFELQQQVEASWGETAGRIHIPLKFTIKVEKCIFMNTVKDQNHAKLMSFITK